MLTLRQRIDQIRTHIKQAEFNAERQPGSVQLLAVSKTKPAEVIAEAYQYGLRHFGESYLQEALQKQRALGAYDITWHFIGPIQSNKTRPIATYFNWVHSVDRFKVAKRLSEQRPEDLPPLNVCLQVNISGENSKAGIMLDELPQLIAEVKPLRNIRLRGVMAIPEPANDYQQQCLPYRELYQTVQRLQLPELDTFSFGMSDDLNAAIAEGSTLVRIGTGLFGARKY